jgi:ketosteroid isomerase-like protein
MADPEGATSRDAKVDLIRRVTAAFNGESPAEDIREFLHPEVEWHGTQGGLTEGEFFEGQEAVDKQVEPSREAWDEWRIEPEEIIDLGGDDVLVMNRETNRGRGSGIELISHTAALVSIRDGKIIRFQGFLDRGEARRAAGLPAEDD